MTDDKRKRDDFVSGSEYGISDTGRPVNPPPSGPMDGNEDAGTASGATGPESVDATAVTGETHTVTKENVHDTGGPKGGRDDITSETSPDE